MRVDLVLVEVLEDRTREVLDSEAENAKTGLFHRGEPFRVQRVDAVRTDELQIGRQPPRRLRGNDRRAQRQDSSVLSKDKDVILKDDRTNEGMCPHDPDQHVETLLGIEPRDPGDAPLRLVQIVGGGAEGAPHRTVVERDESNGTDLREACLPLCLERQALYTIGKLEAVPVVAIRHLLVGCRLDGAYELRLRHGVLMESHDGTASPV